ncbi:disintegrin and metalloproteinase domain-containing protein 21-like [Castor canadensis]|uniref:disintegrin and metalloproteinase domain-containing protein 21-like n=1 Tax=Castor canadensis TaxID=51338 RepID=UPI003D170B8D
MAVHVSLEQVKITLLLLYLWPFLFLSGWPHQAGYGESHSPPEVVIPLRVTERGMKAPNWITYSLHLEGKRYIIHLKAKKFFVYRDLSVFTYNDQGALLEDQPFVQNDCYYHGYVEGDPESLVTVSTCLGGFQGMLQINGVAYEIKPKRLSATFEHLLYKIDSKETQSTSIRCVLTEEEIAQQLKFQENDNSILMQNSNMGWWVHRWFLELAIVVDHGRFVFRDSNISVVEMDVVMAVNIVDDLYNSLDVDVALIAIEIWNTENPFIKNNPHDMMVSFCTWKETNFNSRVHHDVAHIIIKQDYCTSVLTDSFYLGVCSNDRNCGLECVMDDRLVLFVSHLAHELGHTLGMKNDENTTCTCGGNQCIMNEMLLPAQAFSNCSYNHFFENVHKLTCLRDSPKPERIITKKRCGNSVVEDKEECDCGSVKLCEKDLCCLQNCILKPGTVCASGLCCKDCQFMPVGTVCRELNSECDLPEWCNGTSGACPEDVYIEDGTSCLDNGLCYEKRCNDLNEQCKKIFGTDASSANQSCYLAMNTKGDRFGHCGMEGGNYVRCQPEDVLCGRVQCDNVILIPLLSEHNTVHWTQINNTTCWGTDYHFGMTIPDIGEVKDGTHKEKEEITETASVIEEQDFETSPVKEEQKVETSPEKVEQKVETSPVKEEQKVETSPEKVEQKVETSPVKEEQNVEISK